MPQALMQGAALILSPATLYYAPLNTALPAKTLAYGSPWGGSWARVGLTGTPLRFAYTYDVVAAKVQEALADVNRAKTNEAAVLETTLAEINLSLFPLGLEGTFSLTPQSTGVPESENWSVGGSNKLTKRMWGFEGQWNADDGSTFPVRFFVYRATAQAGGELMFDRENFVAGTVLQLGALADMSRAVNDQLVSGYRVTTIAG